MNLKRVTAPTCFVGRSESPLRISVLEDHCDNGEELL